MKLSSMYPVIGSQQLTATKDFYTSHLGFSVTFEADWYISLIREADAYQLAILDHTHATVPEGFRKPVQGLILNFETDDVDEVYERVQAAGLPIHLEIRDEAWGQRHFITSDPNGVLIDVIKIIPPSGEFADQYTDLGNELL
jgi:catechol 2,3-dioxygenase-like lactoylglutathione lyase family enzyme